MSTENGASTRVCGRSKSSQHRTRDCTNYKVCNYCDESGQRQKDCDDNKLMVARQTYRRYADEILEGRLSASEQITESVSTPVTASDEVRKTLDFGEENEVSIINDKDDTATKSVDERRSDTTQTEIQKKKKKKKKKQNQTKRMMKVKVKFL